MSFTHAEVKHIPRTRVAWAEEGRWWQGGVTRCCSGGVQRGRACYPRFHHLEKCGGQYHVVLQYHHWPSALCCQQPRLGVRQRRPDLTAAWVGFPVGSVPVVYTSQIPEQTDTVSEDARRHSVIDTARRTATCYPIVYCFVWIFDLQASGVQHVEVVHSKFLSHCAPLVRRERYMEPVQVGPQ